MKPLYIKKNGQVEKVTGAFAMPASYPAERVAYDNTNSGLSADDAQGAIDEIIEEVNDKVDKETGKGLSTNDYTTNDKNKLAGIAAGATKTASSTTNGNIKINDVETQVYDDSEIQDKMDATTTSATGNPISIADLKSAQIALNPVITFEPIQAGSGTPSPVNQRPISGYDKIEVLSCGVNIWDEEWRNGYYDNNGQFVSNSSYVANKNPIRIGGNMTIYGVEANTYIDNFLCYDKSGTYIGDASRNESNNTRTTLPNTAYVNFRCRAAYGGTYHNDVSVNFPATETSYIASHKTTDLSESLGQTVYGATWYPRTGELTVDRAIYEFSGSETPLAYGYGYRYVVLTKLAKSYDADVVPNVISNQYSAVNRNAISQGNVGISVTNDTVLLSTNNPTGVKLVYELATPFTIQLTPHEIALSQGYNYISTNGTLIELAYHNGELATHADVEQLAETVNGLGEYVDAQRDILRFDYSTLSMADALLKLEEVLLQDKAYIISLLSTGDTVNGTYLRCGSYRTFLGSAAYNGKIYSCHRYGSNATWTIKSVTPT